MHEAGHARPARAEQRGRGDKGSVGPWQGRAVQKAKRESRLARSHSPAAAESGTLIQMGEKACGAEAGEQSLH